ncbi:phenylalanine--tRNA ligase subunit beta [Mycoplasmoides alvi]|uniref:phenylalanine--tRNA ligase subunit beta n=1 Tax=Mycoplasmoides alvi TaxID=78580 RepID=UPI00051AD7B8|nr:phenylalanine--tRNA ligase subunit beta [Mycoplasmoides alvi]
MLLSKKIMSTFIDYIDDIDEKTISNALNSIGAEVEGIYYSPKIDTYLTIGRIVDIKEHPHSEHLTICRVQITSSKVSDIVCGAENVSKREVIGKYVIVALIGSELPNGKTIVSKNINGVISEGMICSYEELNPDYKKYISDNDLKKVIVLDDAKLFDKEITKYISTNDVVFDINVPTNRPEWQGAKFICREIAVALKLNFKDKMRNYKSKMQWFNNPYKVLNYAPSYCNYFDVIGLRSKRVKESTWDLKGILINHMIKPVNDIIDHCTLISLLTGNPINVYDASKIEGELILRIATTEDKFLASDGKWYKILPGDLLVCDRVKIVSIAGIILSKDVMVTSETTSFLIEIANFKKTKILQTAERLHLNTLSSKLFSKQIPLYATKLTIDHVYRYLLKDNVYQQISALNTKCNVDEFYRKIPINFDDIRNLIGLSHKELSDSEIQNILQNLGFYVNGKMVSVPAYRSDIWVWQDIAEEIVKIVNINSLKAEPINANYLFSSSSENNYELITKLNYKLHSLQISSVNTYNLTNFEDAKIFNFFNYENPIKVLNPSSVEHEYFRINMINNLLRVLEYNKKRNNKLKPIFELQSLPTAKTSDFHVGIVVPSKLFENIPFKSGIDNNLLTMKGLSDVIVDTFGFRCEYKPINKSDYLIVNDSLQLVVYDEIIGFMGQIKPSILKKYHLDDNMIYALDINLEKLITSLNRIQHQYTPYSKLQNIDRDITFCLFNNQSFDVFMNIINSIPEILQWEIISIYKKEKINNSEEYVEESNELSIENVNDKNKLKYVNEEKDKFSDISYTVRYYIKQTNKTLSSNEINQISNKLVEKCELNKIFVQK